MMKAAYYDAGLERERLARDMAYWMSVDSISLDRAERIERRIQRQARMTGLSVERIREDIRTDARAMLAEEGIE
ncbi:MAG: hypothetical protein L6Q93_16080 [Phycisphaerae bacterium]|nr:hypothetical protein [Phycisphaerae bacterium]